jgi:C4-dicarboxylate-specific signal transduction histidine kinase
VESIHFHHRTNQELVVKQVVRRAKHHFSHLEETLISFSENPVIKRLSPDEIDEFLQDEFLILKHFNAENIYIFDEHGTLHFTTEASPMKGKNFSSRNFFLKAKASNTVVPITYLTNGKGMDAEQLGNFITTPFFSDNNTFIGVILISFNLSAMIALPRPKECCDNYFLIEGENNVLLSSMGEHKRTAEKISLSTQDISSILLGREGMNEFSNSYDIEGLKIIASGVPLVMASKTLEVLAWVPASHVNILLSKYSIFFVTGILFIFLGFLGTYYMWFKWHVKLRDEIILRKEVEADLINTQQGLEKQVLERTKSLSVLNKALQEEIIQKEEAMEKVSERSDFLQHIMESLTIPFYVIRVHDYTVEIANKSANFGLLTGKETCHELTHNKPEPCNCKEHPCTIKEIQRTRQPVVLEHVHYDTGGAPRHVEVHGYPIFNEDGIIEKVIEYSLDVTDIRKHQEERMKERNLRAIGRLASGIAHEINNPLTNASLNLQILSRKSATCNIKKGCLEKIKNVERNVEKAASIAKELLLFSRQQDIEGILINVNDLINGALLLLEYKMKGLVLQKNLQSVGSIVADPVKIEQVFINVFTNAIEAMDESGILGIHSYDEDNMVVIEISDTGPGIPSEYIDRIFEPFFTTKNIGDGTGLGLSICYGIISRYDGEMYITNIQNKGARITIKLPFAEE